MSYFDFIRIFEGYKNFSPSRQSVQGRREGLVSRELSYECQ